MKKFIVAILIACMVPVIAMADRDHNYRPIPSRDHHDRRGGGVNPWPFIAGAVVGGIIVNEVGRDREREVYREYRPPMRYVNVCEDIMLFDSRGNYIKTERHCRRELVQD